MPRAAGVYVENTFVKGHVTEFTGLNFPENACTDSDNVVITEKGRVTRRLGFDPESSYAALSAVNTDKALSTYIWESVAGQSTTNIVVQQIGNELKFYLLGLSSLSAGYLSGQDINLSTFQVSGNPTPATRECQYASGFGKLLITHPYCEPFYVEYNTTAMTTSATRITIKIRDVKGIDDGFVDRLPTITPQHNYNLKNQGWNVIGSQTAGFSGDILTSTRNSLGYYPADYDIWWLAKNASDAYVAGLLVVNTRGNSQAPRGYYILSAFYQDRSAASGVAGLTVNSSEGARPSSVEWFAGRAFYAGVVHKDYSSTIYFSKIIEQTSEFGYCYQVNDPTAENSSDLLSSDGGTIVIPEAGEIFRLWSIEGSLVVFASNGIWVITGSTGIGFSATDYTVKRLSSIKSLSASGFVDVTGYPVWWTSEGIYGMVAGTSTGAPQVKSLTEDTFKRFIQDVPDESKKYIKGAYNPLERKVIWLYRSTAPTTIAERYQYNKCLCFNVLTGAFNYWTPNVADVSLSGVICVGGTASSFISENVTDTAGNTVTAGGLNVTAQVLSTESSPYVFKYLTQYLDGGSRKWTWSETFNSGFVDWKFFYTSPTVYGSFLNAGYQVRGDGQRDFQSNYVTVYGDSTTPTSCYFQGIWDYALNSNTGRWSSKQRVTFDDNNYRYKFKRIKVRGRGKALQFRLTSYNADQFSVVGWSVYQTGNQTP